MDAIDRQIVNSLQDGLPICERPYAAAAEKLGMAEDELIRRLIVLRDQGVYSRIGPMYHAEELGGSLLLAAMQVPQEDFECVARQVNAFPEVAHNYERDHAFNMWFVLATETPERMDEVLAGIEKRTGLPVYAMPKEEEFFVGLRLRV